MTRTLRVLSLLLLAALAPLAPAQDKKTFEVASVKPAMPLDMAAVTTGMQNGQMPRIGPRVDEQEADYRYMSLKQLIAMAWAVKNYQIEGPDWLSTARFDIQAKLPDGASKDDAPAMLQALLEDRFKLTVHHETKQGPMLALVVAKGGSKMQAAAETPKPLDSNAPLQPNEMKVGQARVTINKDGTATMNMGAKGAVTYKMDPATRAMRVDASGVSMSSLADMLTQFSAMGGGTGRPIEDKTDLKGNYQVSMEFPLTDLMNMNMARAAGTLNPGMDALPNEVASDPGGSSSLNESVAALGLKLEPRNDALDELVVDHVEKAPTEN